MPLPSQHEADGQKVEVAIQQALKEAAEQHVEGNAVTPFILQRVAQLTGGASLRANIALIKHNARVGAEIAAVYSRACRYSFT